MRHVSSLVQLLGSPRMAVILWIVLALVLGVASHWEATHGREVALWHVYHAQWFACLLAAVSIHLIATISKSFPWRRTQLGSVLVRCGVLLLLAGFFVSSMYGVQGRVRLAKGGTAEYFDDPHQSQVTVAWADRPQEPPFEFPFEPGPASWNRRNSLDLGEVDGVSARIVEYYRHGERLVKWVPDQSNKGGPAVKLRVAGPDGGTVAALWMSAQKAGNAVLVGPLRIQLEQATSPAMIQDFLQSPAVDLGQMGSLTMYAGNNCQRVSVDEQLGQSIDLGNGITVRIVEYLCNAKPDRLGTFTSVGDLPKNPMLELRVWTAEAQEPIRQVAFAKDPLLNLDGVYDRICPVRFRWRHPAIKAPVGVELMQDATGKLHGRLTGSVESEAREVRSGDRLTLPGPFAVQIQEYLPYARQQVTFHDVDYALKPAQGTSEIEPAALVEVSIMGETHREWMQRSDPVFGWRKVETPSGLLSIQYGIGRLPLGFTIERVDSEPGSAEDGSALTNPLRLVNAREGVDRVRNLVPNEPIRHAGFTITRQELSPAQSAAGAIELHVATNPGRNLQRFGGVLMGLGILVLFAIRLRSWSVLSGSRRKKTVHPVELPVMLSNDRLAA